MAKFYGTLEGSRGQATRCGTANSGIRTAAASWAGAITVTVYQDTDGTERFIVSMRPWHGRGGSASIASGAVGKPETIVYGEANHVRSWDTCETTARN